METSITLRPISTYFALYLYLTSQSLIPKRTPKNCGIIENSNHNGPQ